MASISPLPGLDQITYYQRLRGEVAKGSDHELKILQPDGKVEVTKMLLASADSLASVALTRQAPSFDPFELTVTYKKAIATTVKITPTEPVRELLTLGALHRRSHNVMTWITDTTKMQGYGQSLHAGSRTSAGMGLETFIWFQMQRYSLLESLLRHLVTTTPYEIARAIAFDGEVYHFCTDATDGGGTADDRFSRSSNPGHLYTRLDLMQLVRDEQKDCVKRLVLVNSVA